MATLVDPITSAIEWLGDDEARAILEQNTRNRPLNQARLATLVRAMENGDFTFNGESVQIAADGTLLNGQHRLTAITLSKARVPLLVVRGLPVETQETIDTGLPRSFADALAIRGEKFATLLAATTGFVWRMRTAGVPYHGAKVPQPSPQELAVCLAANPDIRDALAIGDRMRRSGVPLEAPAAAGLFYLTAERAPETAARFFDRLADGVGLSATDPILALRNFLIADRAKKRRSSAAYRCAVAIKAWNAFVQGREIKTLRWATKGKNAEAFPTLMDGPESAQ